MTTRAREQRDLPPGWRWARLDAVCGAIGEPVLPRAHPEETFAHYSVPAYDVGNGPVLELGAVIGSGKTLIPAGVVLFCKLNPRINRVWRITDSQAHRRICSTEFLPLAPRSAELVPTYLEWVLREPRALETLRGQARAATKSRERLKPHRVMALSIPLPPLPEQKRIVAILNQQRAVVERARAAAETQLEAARALPAAYLREVFESPEAKAWPKAPLGAVSEVVSGVALGRDLRGAETRSVPYLRVANVKDGRLDLSDVYETDATGAEIRQLALRRGDLLLTEGGDRDKLGRGTVWDEQIPECIHQNHIFRVRFRHGRFDPWFVSAQMASVYGKAYFFAHGKQTTGIATINQTVLKGFPIMEPGISEQKRIVAILNAQMAASERARMVADEGLGAVERLPGAILRKAFRGEL